jgi:beta-galactosidase/beta-glucuronidase
VGSRRLGGVNAQCWFWINGAYLGHNESYCVTYKYNITDLVHAGQRAVIVVKVCNGVPSGKGLMNWIQRLGGLYRDVEIEATSDASIDNA